LTLSTIPFYLLFGVGGCEFMVGSQVCCETLHEVAGKVAPVVRGELDRGFKPASELDE
jgi:hypothetical protein